MKIPLAAILYEMDVYIPLFKGGGESVLKSEILYSENLETVHSNINSAITVYYLPYNPQRKKFARRLRKNSTLGEVLLWMQLRAGGFQGYTFNRQKPIGNYIVDFYCRSLKLVIEVDGAYHTEDGLCCTAPLND